MLGALSCSYADPDYTTTTFRCEAAEACPAGQACLGGLCQYSGGARDGVACGPGLACAPDQKCCFDEAGDSRCIPASEPCPATMEEALCDGAEDCAPGAWCCDSLAGPRCGPPDTTCNVVSCRESADCPTDEPYCCFATVGRWGECSFRACGD